jgi:hypothetical protein
MFALTDSQQNTVDERMKEGYLPMLFLGGVRAFSWLVEMPER